MSVQESVGTMCAGSLILAAFATPVAGQVTSRVSVSSTGLQADHESSSAAISADGRIVAFESLASNLVAGDTNDAWDVFVRDLHTGQTSRVSVGSTGAQANGDCYGPSVSADRRFVAFHSIASNLVPGDTNAAWDVFVRDRRSSLTSRISVDSTGAQSDGSSFVPSISADGRYVAFMSGASDLVAGDNNAWPDIFLHDRQTGTTSLVSLGTTGAQANNESFSARISADGTCVAFTSYAANLVPGDTNGVADVFVRDLQAGWTIRASVDSAGALGNDASAFPTISSDGRYVAFQSWARNLVPADTNVAADVFVHDRQTGATSRVSVDSAGAQGGFEHQYPEISPDGRWVAFHSLSSLVPGDTGFVDVFVHDRWTGLTDRASVDSAGAQSNGHSDNASISADGRFVAFQSFASNLVAGDTNGEPEVFLRDRNASGFTSLCDPGSAGVSTCPCANPPSGAGRGCDNSAGTGGASLAASGLAYLSMDSLSFTTAGERPTATSIVLQGSALVASGIVYGQGVRCAGATLKRLYTKTASGGSITAPDSSAGDPTVSARSAALGSPIGPGENRWYLVFYRDPVVLGGCPASSTFNATQTGKVVWLP